MTFQRLPTITAALTEAFSRQAPLTELPVGAYASMRYPKFPALMRFTVRQYEARGYGNVFTMDTRAMGGLMQLCTLVFTPNLGTDVPLLLMDVMAMGKKRTAFVEYYDLTAGGASCPALAETARRFSALPDYPEKPAWYVGERAPYSLIKGGKDDDGLLALLADSIAAYGETCAAARPRPENLPPLVAFVERMCREGNPSSATMNKVLGKAGAERFFRTLVMPAQNTTQVETGGITL